jgi:hypothetical protein
VKCRDNDADAVKLQSKTAAARAQTLLPSRQWTQNLNLNKGKVSVILSVILSVWFEDTKLVLIETAIGLFVANRVSQIY